MAFQYLQSLKTGSWVAKIPDEMLYELYIIKCTLGFGTGASYERMQKRRLVA